MNTLAALKRSPLGLDLYLWLVYRTFALRAPLRLTWKQVYRQFGAHPDKASDKRTVLNFRRKVLRELKKIKLAWPELNYTTAPGVLILHPSIPAIAPLNQGQLSKLGLPIPASQRPVSGLCAPGWTLGRLKVPAASYGESCQPAVNRLFPQAYVIRGSFPRTKVDTPLAPTLIRTKVDTPPPQF